MIVAGLMSGTSVDGIDACLTEVFPDFSFKIIETHFSEYPENVKKQIFKIIESSTSAEEICSMNFVIGECFAQAANEVIKKAGLSSKDVDLIGSHGQTVFHKPFDEHVEGLNQKSTLQLGEGAVIAERTGVTTVSDFRTADIAAGGQGAPLVCFADEILFKDSGISRAIQNIGGMANVTVVSPNCETFGFDTGPGNVLIDYFMRKFFGKEYDKDGLVAAQGNVDELWLDYLLEENYYDMQPPKTTGRELFSPEYAERILETAPENPFDIIATVTALTAKSIYNSYENFVFPKTKIDEIILGGGGAYNPVLVKKLKTYFGSKIKVLRHEDFGIPDMFKEALAFAFLAYATVNKIPNNLPSCTGAKHKAILGKVSYSSKEL